MKAIVFEQLTSLYWTAVWWYRLRRYRVYYLQKSPGRRLGAWLVRQEAGGGVRLLTLREPLYKWNNPAADAAFEATEAQYHARYDQHRLVQRAVAELGDDAAHLAYKKGFAQALEPLFSHRLLSERVRDALPDAQRLLFVPAQAQYSGGAWRGQPPPVQNPLWSYPWWVRFGGALRRGAEQWVGLALVLKGLAKGLRRARRRPPEPADFAVMIVAPAREFANDVRGVDFLLDGKEIRRDNTLFIPLTRLAPDHRRELSRRQLRVAAPDGSLTGSAALRLARWTLRLAWSSLQEPAWLTRITGVLVHDYWAWATFLDRCPVRNLVSYADFGLRHYGRNLALRRTGATTWYYTDATNTNDAFYTKSDGLPHRHWYWDYLLYDNFISWGPRYTRYMRMHGQGVRRYFEVGCMWSEHVALMRSGAIPSRLPELLRAARWHPGLKLIAVFDSTYDNDTMTTYADGEAFAAGICQLLEARRDVFVVFKEKKPRGYHVAHGSGGRLEALYAELEAHERCCFIGPRASGAELIACADLTVSFPFSSTTLEAVGARRRGLFFDPNSKYPSSYFNRVPGLVARGWTELSRRVDELLAMTDAEYGAYLERHVKGDLDPFLDARGLSRFRALLTGGAAAQMAAASDSVPVLSAPGARGLS
ncbi:MAG: polysaccharide biosynthesis PFTS motif protein [Chloroflexi bacterium]|nr:polysaccharide biosynthesis PFTS motif protein [Chloroflexota bacterium]